MADKQTEADKVAAMKEYRQQHDSAVDRMASLKAARLAREASAEAAEAKAAADDKTPAGKKKAAAKKKAAKKPAVRIAKPR